VEYVFGDIAIACSNTDRVMFPDAAEANAIAAGYRPLVDVAAVRIDRLKRELRGNLPRWENALRKANVFSRGSGRERIHGDS
jgi:hypothetical protein